MRKNKAVVIGTYHGREDWLKDCLQSLSGYTEYPVLTVTIPWELNVICWIYNHTNVDEFLFLQDTVVVKQYGWITELFNQPGSVSLSMYAPFHMYLGKYTRTNLARVDFPPVGNKRQAVSHESVWTKEYAEASDKLTCLWPMEENKTLEDRHGRTNKVIENEYLVKYKGTWDSAMIPDEPISEYSRVPPEYMPAIGDNTDPFL